MASRRSPKILPTLPELRPPSMRTGQRLGGKAAPAQDGFSGDQQFFIAYGQNWGTKAREAALRQQVMTDGHAPAEYRADDGQEY